ncbi:solute carrier family 12 member 8 isoform X2 [Oncorhynchus nerka]|uniref:solute carrier family 12 member 8 isoform X2 n=1 Tax=Oncorhynchus nerka TaxID=8023 RepID=UPI0011302A06|nr:solute carrier family 12 member 8 isoform X2 [Oncorhynchus nerka]
MEALPFGWMLHRSNVEDVTELLKARESRRASGSKTTPVQDLFHEDAQGSQHLSQPWWRVKLFVWEPVLFGTWDGVFTTCMINIFGVVLFLRTGWLVCVAGAMYITGFSESIAQLLSLQSEWAVRGMSVAVLLGLLGINLAGVKWIVRLQLILLAVLAVSTLDFVIGTFSHLDPEHGFVGYSEELLRKNTLPDYTTGEGFFTVFGVFFPAATGVMAGFNMSSDLQRPEHNIPVGTLAAVCTSWFLYLVFVFLLGAICTREALHFDFLIAEKVSLVGFLFLLGLYISSLASCMGGLYGAPRILQVIAQERVIPALAFLAQGKGPNKTPVAAIVLTSLLTMAFIFIGQVNVLAPIVTINFMLTYSFIDYSYFSVAMTYNLQPREKRVGPAKRPGTGASSFTNHTSKPLMTTTHQGYGTEGDVASPGKGTLLEFTRDMDQIFPLPNGGEQEETEKDKATEKVSMPGLRGRIRRVKAPAKKTLMDSFGLDLNSNAFPSEGDGGVDPAPPGLGECIFPQERPAEPSPDPEEVIQDKTLLPVCNPIELDPPGSQRENTGSDCKPDYQGSEIQPMPDSFYAKFCNHWIALIGALCSILIMFVIQWVYALANIIVALVLFLYIGKASPGLPIGVASRFSFFRWIRTTLSNLGRGELPRDQIIVTPSLSGVGMETRQLTEENLDFASRDRYHQSSFIEPDRMAHLQLN